MRDEGGWLWSYQPLNPDGSKFMAKGCRARGLFHALGKLANGAPIGVAESYVTAATRTELTQAPTVCAFSGDNLASIAQTLRRLYPSSPLIIFADNDTHLASRGMPNAGLVAAQKAIDAVGGYHRHG
jgi:phage/plasmid primase-like uncharacterized protein